jgi:hypothetical protein
MAEIYSLKAIGATIASFWARSALFLWCLAASCFVVLIALLVVAHWQVGDAPALLAEYGTKLGLAFLVLFVFAAFKTYSQRPQPILSLLPQEGKSFCGQVRQTDGRIITQLSLRFQAANLTDGVIVLSAIKLRRPFASRAAILTKVIMVSPIEPRSLTYGSASFLINQPVGHVGKTMRAVVAVQDHAGRWHKLIFPPLTIGEEQS